jgi:hypothetical protein
MQFDARKIQVCVSSFAKAKQTLVAMAALGALSTACADIKTSGYVELGFTHSSAQRPWVGGGTGAVGTGNGVASEARLGFTVSGETRWSGRVSLLGRKQFATDLGRGMGVLDAFIDYGNLSDDGFRVRSGFAFLGTSFENVEDFWQTPYTLSLSALNSWGGEEVRPLGITLSKRFESAGGSSTDVSATVYGDNDTSAALLAWRGFTAHSRLSVYGETLPILPLPSLRDQPPGAFSAQRDDGSNPFGPDLDGRPGFALRSRNSLSNGAHVSLFFTDNRGDRKLHGLTTDQSEYAWHTRFGQLGFDFPLTENLTLLGEWLRGRTNMGFPPGGNVSFDFDASYLMLSQAITNWTLSARAESFHINELDQSAGERNTQNGAGVTLAALRNSGDWRLGFEAKYLDIVRPGNREFGGAPQQGGGSVQMVLRRYF